MSQRCSFEVSQSQLEPKKALVRFWYLGKFVKNIKKVLKHRRIIGHYETIFIHLTKVFFYSPWNCTGQCQQHRAWAVSTHLFPDWHLHCTLHCIGSQESVCGVRWWPCVCVRPVGACECLCGCKQTCYESSSVCIYVHVLVCIDIDSVCSLGVLSLVTVFTSGSPCCVTGHPRP